MEDEVDILNRREEEVAERKEEGTEGNGFFRTDAQLRVRPNSVILEQFCSPWQFSV